MDNPSSIRAILIDLDGTLADTAGEIGLALTRTLEDFAIAPLRQAEVVALIGKGVRVLIERALNRRGVVGLDTEVVLEQFHDHYRETVATGARLYPGAREGIEMLRAAGRKLAVVTNKPRSYSERLLAYFDVAAQFDALVAGDDGIAPKPAGDMLLAACEQMGVKPADALMLGDSDNDVLAARAAGCTVWCVPYGYNEGRAVATLGCDRIVGSIEEAARLLA
ncbi:MAG: phosphoglycolate phosphatase [Usitatibacter sp.]